MRIKRIEIEGEAGRVAIEREAGRETIRIDSTMSNPGRRQPYWLVHELRADAPESEFFAVAESIQARTDGKRGTNSMIHDYFRELQRFAD